MTHENGFVLHPDAANDIAEILEYIGTDNPTAAEGVREEILASIRRLVRFPYQGHVRPDLTTRPLRFCVVRDYLIAYAPDETPLSVLAVLHGRRYPKLLAAKLLHRK
jgi:plasmid stabilization system protein ParE